MRTCSAPHYLQSVHNEATPERNMIAVKDTFIASINYVGRGNVWCSGWGTSRLHLDISFDHYNITILMSKEIDALSTRINELQFSKPANYFSAICIVNVLVVNTL